MYKTIKTVILFLCIQVTSEQLQAQEMQSFQIKMNGLKTVQVDCTGITTVRTSSQIISGVQWLPVSVDAKKTLTMGSRVVLRLKKNTTLADFNHIMQEFSSTAVHPLAIPNTYLIKTDSTLSALQLAERFSVFDNVRYAYPEYQIKPTMLAYASQPDDKYYGWGFNWYIDYRNEDGSKSGWDMNVRSAWAKTKGKGITIGILDTGVESAHPDLTDRMQNDLHYNVFTSENTPDPLGNYGHGTCVAGYAAATAYNEIGTCGIAPEADIAGLVMFSPTNTISNAQLAEMYLHRNEIIRIQNQSWEDERMEPLSSVEQDALDTIYSTNEGRGVMVVRAAGNSRSIKKKFGDANDESRNSRYASTVVGAVLASGMNTDYSSPGACILVAAPGGKPNDKPSIGTTDLVGTRGYNYAEYSSPDEDYNNYASGNMTSGGTSFSSPIIAGACALILSENPDLTVRDVRHILVQSTQYPYKEDTDLSTNASGFLVSHNLGFGIPDIGQAVSLAQHWTNIPEQEAIEKTISYSENEPIPLEGFVLHITSPTDTNINQQIKMVISDTVFPDHSTAICDIVDLGKVVEPIEEDLTGKAAMIQRGEITFMNKIQYAHEAGASFVIIYNNELNDDLINTAGVNDAPIPSVFISGNSGSAIQELLEEGTIQAQLVTAPLTCTFEVDQDFICEDVTLHVNTVGENCDILRISMISPEGTRSLMHRYNYGRLTELDWNFLSTHHFYEPTRGTWKVEIANMPLPANTNLDGGTFVQNYLKELKLTVRGIPITDTDLDALDDSWEMQHFDTLAYNATDVVSPSGYSNARWQIIGDEFVQEAEELSVDISTLQEGKLRLSWPSVEAGVYEVLSAEDETLQNWTVIDTVSGSFPHTEYLTDQSDSDTKFLRIRKVK